MKKRFVSLALILMLCGCQLVPGGDDTGKDQQIGVANVVNENVDNPVIDDGNNTDTQNDNDEDSFELSDLWRFLNLWFDCYCSLKLVKMMYLKYLFP